jgi:hypothetical protein
MELLERYLQAVKRHLPLERQDDILAELRANMEAQLEDKESELGRKVTQGEAEDWLRAMGPPVLVASRYHVQRYLIGPALYPLYLYVLRMAALWALIIYMVVNVVLAAFSSSTNTSAVDALMRLPGTLILVAGWVTLIFAALEFVAARYPEKCPPVAGLTGHWSPSSLPPLEKAETGRKPRSYAQAIAELVLGFAFLIWLLLIPAHPFLLMGPGAILLDVGPFRLADVWWTFYWWIVGLNGLQLTWRCVDLLRGAWQYPSPLQHIVFKTVGLIPVALILLSGGSMLVLLKNPAVNQAHYGGVLATINHYTRLGFEVVLMIGAVQLAWDIVQWRRHTYEKRAMAMQ